MMDMQDDREFNFSFDKNDNDVSFDKKDHDGEYTREILEKKVDSLGWKVTVMAIIIPCLIGVVVALSYFSITKKVSDFQHDGSATVQEFSTVYDGKLADIQKKLAAQEEEVGKKLAMITQNATAIKENLNSIKSLTAADSKISGSVQTVQANLDQLAGSVKTIQTDLEKMAEAVGGTSRQILALRQQIETDETRLKGLADTAANKPDAETVRRMLADSEKKFQTNMDASANVLKDRLKSLEDRMSKVDRQTGVSPQGASPSARTSTAPAAVPSATQVPASRPSVAPAAVPSSVTSELPTISEEELDGR